MVFRAPRGVRQVVNATVNNRAKLIMHRLVARQLRRDPRILEAARAVLDRRAAEGRDAGYAEQWGHLLDLGYVPLAGLLWCRSEVMDLLRSCSPFAIAAGIDFTDMNLRTRIWRKARLIEGSPGSAQP
jgi:hypothetical protein